jgi:hypothetical protein
MNRSPGFGLSVLSNRCNLVLRGRGLMHCAPRRTRFARSHNPRTPTCRGCRRTPRYLQRLSARRELWWLSSKGPQPRLCFRRGKRCTRRFRSSETRLTQSALSHQITPYCLLPRTLVKWMTTRLAVLHPRLAGIDECCRRHYPGGSATGPPSHRPRARSFRTSSRAICCKRTTSTLALRFNGIAPGSRIT